MGADGRGARAREIGRVLARHGLGYLVDGAPPGRWWRRALRRPGAARRTAPEHVRQALEELGATFVKLGQILSTRPDLLPPAFVDELAKLQDGAPPLPFPVVQEVLRTELGRPLEELFAAVDSEPLAAGSIGQAHAARLLDGTEVVVKVRRPGVVEQVELDLALVGQLARTAGRRSELARHHDLVGLAEEFGATLRAELDYVREAHNAERFGRSFASDPAVHVPRVFWPATTERVLTLERVRGVKISDLAELDRRGIDRGALARRAAAVLLKMVFEDGFFHADPHPGNFFVEDDGRIGLIDFGMVGEVDAALRAQLAQLLLALAERDADALVDCLFAIGVAEGPRDRALLRRDLGHLVARYYNRPLGGIVLSELLGEVLALVRRHGLALPSGLALLVKTAMMDEGLGARLDPSFRLTEVIAPYARRLVLGQYAPGPTARRVGRAGLAAAQLGVDLPVHVRRIVTDLERGGLQFGVHPEGLEPTLGRLERLANRVVLGIIAAAFINGLAVLASFYRPPGLESWVGFGFAVGFALASALGAYLAWSILTGPRR
jgi:ubiquinone biosynthesis protein